MNRIIILIISLVVVGCCSENKHPNNGLNGDVKMLTEHSISIKYDSLNYPIRDTLTIIKKFYNNRNQIIEQNEDILFSEEKMDITYEYNRCNSLQKERVKMSFDSTAFEINHLYKNSLREKSISESTRDHMYFKQIGLNEYDSDENVTKSSISQIFVNLKNGDTIKNSVQIDEYNKNGIAI